MKATIIISAIVIFWIIFLSKVSENKREFKSLLGVSTSFATFVAGIYLLAILSPYSMLLGLVAIAICWTLCGLSFAKMW